MVFGIFPEALLKETRERLASRYPRDAHTDGYPALAWPQIGFEAELSACIASGDGRRAWQHPALYLRKDAPGPLTAEDVVDALTLSAYATRTRVRAERDLIEMARRRDVSWAQIGKALGFRNGREVQRHFRLLCDLVGDSHPRLAAPDGEAQ